MASAESLDTDPGPSPEKQRRIDSDRPTNSTESTPTAKNDHGKEINGALIYALYNLHYVGPYVKPLEIKLSNGAVQTQGVPFSKAWTDCVKMDDHPFFLSDFFEKGVVMLLSYLEHDVKPEEVQLQLTLRKLLNCVEKAWSGELFPIADFASLTETQFTTLLANHLFGKLTISQDYIIDKHCPGKTKNNECVCGIPDCKMTGYFGDTSIGHEDVWHGNLDIILNTNGVAIDVLEAKEESPGGKSPVEVKSYAADLSRNPQLIAETIVFSFFQKKRHPEYTNFLFPCLGIGTKDLTIMFYDSQYDVLLETSPIPIFEPFVDNPQINLTMVLTCWLVVNYKYLCTGLPDKMKAYKTNFFTVAKDKIQLYEKELKFGNVGKGKAFKLQQVSVREPEHCNTSYEEIGNRVLALRKKERKE